MTLGPAFPDTLQAARAGAPWAWTTLYRDLAPAVTGYLRAHGAREPEDLTSEVFVAVVRGLGDFKGDEAGFRSWVFVIAHRRLLDERRRNFRHPVDLVPTYVVDTPVEGADVEALARVSVEQIRALFSRLTDDQRDVLLLRIVAGLTVEEIAEAVGKRAGAVKALQRRGLAALARIISKEAVPP
ncbi:MAG: RNA polymerase sigma factor [Actinomycetota bacterium]